MLPSDKRILIVDDDPTVIEIVKSYLIKLGIKMIVSADSPNQAKEVLVSHFDKNETFDLILCDHHMPGSTGLDFITYVRMSLRFKDISYITVTSDSQRSVVLPHITAGADAYIVKPVNETDLYNKIIQVWKKRSVISK